MFAILRSFKFLAGVITGLFTTEAVEDYLTPDDVTPNQSTPTRIAYAIAIGVVVAIVIEYLKKKKIL
jgi:hypothetical protein